MSRVHPDPGHDYGGEHDERVQVDERRNDSHNMHTRRF
jgi:hypothetical protein